MTNIQHNIKIQNEKFVVILNETFYYVSKYKIFQKAVQGCIELKNDFTFFNGIEFLVHIPHRILVDSVIVTSIDTVEMIDLVKSKIESLVTK